MERRKNNVKKDERRGQVRGGATKTSVEYTAVYKVNRSDTLLEFLLRKCNTSRNNIKSFLARRQVVVNGNVVTQFDFPLAKDDEVKLAKKPLPSEATKRGAKGVPVVRQRRLPPIKILYEDEDFIAIDKPAGLLSVESDKEKDCAYACVFEYLKTQGKNVRPYVLHRIDKETSGVLIFAKNAKIHSLMRLNWNDLVTLREYYAVAEGVFENKTDTVLSYLKENVNNVVYSTNDPTGQKAVTHYEVLGDNGHLSLLRVKIDTGRKNQIRVHMQLIGHPIVGDEKYGCSKNPLGRLGLHASKLEFTHPVSKQTLLIAAPTPGAFRAAVNV